MLLHLVLLALSACTHVQMAGVHTGSIENVDGEKFAGVFTGCIEDSAGVRTGLSCERAGVRTGILSCTHGCHAHNLHLVLTIMIQYLANHYHGSGPIMNCISKLART